MHIGIDISRVSVRERTGTERYSYELLAALARSHQLHRYTLYCNAVPQQLPPLSAAMTIRSMPLPRLWTHLRLGPETWLHPPDCLFVPSHVVPCLPPRRSVVTIHDLGYLAFPQAHTARRRLELGLTTRWSATVATRVIAISQATADDLTRHYGISPAKIRVIHHGLSPAFRPTPDPAVVERYALTSEYLLYVGTLQPRKNLQRLIEAFAQIAHTAPHLQLLLAGRRGWLTAQIEQQAAALGIAAQVRFLGYVADADLPALYSGALAFLFPSLYEGFGMPVLEAMACGTPVLTSRTSSLGEVAGDAALLVNPHSVNDIANNIQRLVHEPALRAELRERGMRHATRFTWDRCAAETLAVIEESGTAYRMPE